MLISYYNILADKLRQLKTPLHNLHIDLAFFLTMSNNNLQTQSNKHKNFFFFFFTESRPTLIYPRQTTTKLQLSNETLTHD